MNRITIILSALLLLTSCSHDNLGNDRNHEEGSRSIMLRAMTRSSGAGEGAGADMEHHPVFMVWIGDDHEKFGNEEILPYFVSRPKGTVDDYSTTPYNTGYPYIGDKEMYANGYSPSCLTTDEGEYPYTSLIVPEGLAGYLDITASQGFVHGNAGDPLESETMRFEHLLSKVNFMAKLGDIPSERYFRNVRITVAGKGVLTSRIAWGNNDRYSASETVSSEDTFWSAADMNTNQMDPNEVNPREIGSVHIHPGQSGITFDVEVEISETVTFDSSDIIRTRATVDFVNLSSEGITLSAGDEYDITITILYDSFVFKGNKAVWQEGGKIPLPF